MPAKNLKDIWSVGFVIEKYRSRYKDKYLNYKTLIHNLIKSEINILRNNLLSDETSFIPDIDIFIDEINSKINYFLVGKIKKIINATGIIISTNFGRSPILDTVLEEALELNKGYFNLEYDIEKSVRNSRQEHLEYLLTKLTGSESAFVVNNASSAIFLICNTFAKNKKVIVSRGELIEIGDSFRLSEIIEASQSIIKEVGTTNKTYIKDYEKAIDNDTAILLKSHTSNYKIIGFTESVNSRDIAHLAKKNNLISFEDIGSGLLFNLDIDHLKNEPTAKDKINDGIDLVCFSGDKLLGSSQAGIILGKKALISQIKINPIARTMRIDKLCLSVLESSLRIYFMENEFIKENIPILKMITLSYQDIFKRTENLHNNLLNVLPDLDILIVDSFSQVGGGSLPEENILTPVLSIKPLNFSINKLDKKLKKLVPSIIGTIEKDRFIINLRAVFNNEDELILNNLINTLS